MRIAFHAIDGVGLGHLVRAVCLAIEVRAMHPAAEVVIVTNARDVSLVEREGLDFVQLPPKLSEPHADPARVFEGLPEAVDRAATLAVLEAFRPDLVVFDTHAPREVVSGARALGARPVIVLRERRDLIQWLTGEEAMLFDRIVLPHGEDEIALPADLPEDLPLVRTGPIVRRMTQSKRVGGCEKILAGPGYSRSGVGETRSEATVAPLPSGTTDLRSHPLRRPRHPRVLVTAGGGGQPGEVERFLAASADAHQLARARIPGLRTTLVTGPYGVLPAGYPGLTVIRMAGDLPALMADADLVVSQAGYNTINELRALRKPAILVPGRRRMEDQAARARRLVRIGAAVTASPRARTIADRLEAILASGAPERLREMSSAHGRWPLVPANRAAAAAVLWPLSREEPSAVGDARRRDDPGLLSPRSRDSNGANETKLPRRRGGPVARGRARGNWGTASTHTRENCTPVGRASLPAQCGCAFPGGLEARPTGNDPVTARGPIPRRAGASAKVEPSLRPNLSRSGPSAPPRASRAARIVLVAHDFPPRIGGMETAARETAEALARSGVDVTVYTTRRLGGAFARGVRVRELFTPLDAPNPVDGVRDLLLTINACLADAPDAVHLWNGGLSPWVPLLRAALPCPVTVSVHGNDLLSPWVHAGGGGWREAARMGLAAADGVAAVSKFAGAIARDGGARKGHVAVVPNGVDAIRFSPGARDPATRTRYGIAPGDEVVLTVSRLASRKGHATMLGAMASLLASRPRAVWLYTGEGERLRAELAAMARELGVGGRARSLGFVEEADLPALYRAADVFALVPEDRDPADAEGFGIALLEAAACGVPAVASRTGGIPEAVAEGVTGLLTAPGDAGAVAHALERLLGNAAEARAMGSRARARAEREFGWERTAAALLKLWSGTEHREAAWGRPAGRVLATLASHEPESAHAHVLEERVALTSVVNGASLSGLARRTAVAVRLEGEARTAALARERDRGRSVRLRAQGAGERLLPAALADCERLGFRPSVELRLGRFLERHFRARLLPQVERVHLHHVLGRESAMLSRLEELEPSAVAAIASVTFHVERDGPSEARAVGWASRPSWPAKGASPAGAVECASLAPQAHGLAEWFRTRGVPATLPPELAGFATVTPAAGPPTAMVEPTNRCNLACPTCPTGTGKIRPLPDMTLDRFEHVMEQLAPRLRNLALWNYGEPTLNRRLPDMAASAKRHGVRVVKTSTNVHFLEGARGRALLESGLDVLILSLDGATEASYGRFRKRGDFARVSRAVAALCAQKRRLGLDRPSLELQFIAMRHNEGELELVRELAAKWGVDRLRIKTVGADDEANRELVPREPALSRYRADGRTPSVVRPFCTMPWQHTVINVDGSVTPCCYLRPDMGQEFVMGNVFEAPFARIWSGERYQAFRKAMLTSRETMPVCNRCRGGTSELLAAVEEVGE